MPRTPNASTVRLEKAAGLDVQDEAESTPEGVCAREDHFVILRGATWADYQRLRLLRGEEAVPRLTYLEGTLQLMTPSMDHESIKSVIGRLIEVWCLEFGVDFSPVGSWTIEDPAVARGVEPDECYVFRPTTGATRPDLTIEVVWTSGGVDKLQVYAELGVREVWFWRRGGITPHVLRPGGYVAVERSECLAALDLGLLASFVARRDASVAATIRAYREALRGLG